METLFGKFLADIANLAGEKWYSAMGLIGLLVFAYVLLFGTAQDDILVAAISMAMMGVGFGEAETRSLRQEFTKHLGRSLVATTKVRQQNPRSVILFIFGATAVCAAIARAIYIL